MVGVTTLIGESATGPFPCLPDKTPQKPSSSGPSACRPPRLRGPE
jgi:hypothetical protein